jgi:hypothetical protein
VQQGKWRCGQVLEKNRFRRLAARMINAFLSAGRQIQDAFPSKRGEVSAFPWIKVADEAEDSLLRLQFAEHRNRSFSGELACNDFISFSLVWQTKRALRPVAYAVSGLHNSESIVALHLNANPPATSECGRGFLSSSDLH